VQPAAAPRLEIAPLEATATLRRLAYDAIKKAITEMDIYGHPHEIRLDERQLSHDLGVSRTPIREAITLLEQEGFVRSVPRRGIFVVRKSKREIIDLILVWAALESMAARLAAERASDEEIAGLRHVFDVFQTERPEEHPEEYSQANMEFHRTIIRLSRCRLIVELTENLFIHMRAIRAVSMRQQHRAERSIGEHMRIIMSLEAREVERAERLVRDHTLGLAEHVEKHGVFPD
jgi:DNA-binding GntR family transcriptional regulator